MRLPSQVFLYAGAKVWAPLNLLGRKINDINRKKFLIYIYLEQKSISNLKYGTFISYQTNEIFVSFTVQYFIGYRNPRRSLRYQYKWCYWKIVLFDRICQTIESSWHLINDQIIYFEVTTLCYSNTQNKLWFFPSNKVLCILLKRNKV